MSLRQPSFRQTCNFFRRGKIWPGPKEIMKFEKQNIELRWAYFEKKPSMPRYFYQICLIFKNWTFPKIYTRFQNIHCECILLQHKSNILNHIKASTCNIRRIFVTIYQNVNFLFANEKIKMSIQSNRIPSYS